MADLTNIECSRNGSVDFSQEAGAASQTIALAKDDEKYLLLVENTDANTVLVTVEAGDYNAKDLGDFTVEVAQNELELLGPFEGARFKDEDEKLSILLTDADGSPFSGTVTNVKLSAIELPG